MNILVTGIAGFIGSRVAQILAQRGDIVVGVDNINDYYDVQLKYARLRELLGIEVEQERRTKYEVYESLKYQTNADCTRLEKEMGYNPKVRLHEGVGKFMEWFKEFYK